MEVTYRTIHYGVGAIGSEILRLAAAKSALQPVGAVDTAPTLVGRDAGEAVGLDSPLGFTISSDADSVLASTAAEVVLHSTGSWIEQVRPELMAAVRAGKNVISTCEELSYPWRSHPDLAEEIDREARAHGVTVLGTGVNPGFVMDTLVLALTAPCQEVTRVEVRRIVDVSKRRMQLQRKVGTGITLEEFRERASTARFGHVGLRESAELIAHGLGWPLDHVEETLEPVVAGDRAAGIHQTVRCRLKSREVILMELEMSRDVADPRDEIIIEGRPPIRTVIKGGVQGDLATAGVIVNAVPAVVHAVPGLLTMAELALVMAFDTTPK